MTRQILDLDLEYLFVYLEKNQTNHVTSVYNMWLTKYEDAETVMLIPIF